MNNSQRWETKDENGQALLVYFPHHIFYLFHALFGGLTKSQILIFIDKILTANSHWSITKIRQLTRKVQKENVPFIVINKNQLDKPATIIIPQQKKWGIIYEGKLHTPCNPTLTLQTLKELQETTPETLLAIVNTTDQQPFPEEIRVAELKIVYFDDNK